MAAVFKIAKTSFAMPRDPAQPYDVGGRDLLSRHCHSEVWSGDLSTGLFLLDTVTASLHGIEGNECGLLHLVRRYDDADRNDVLALLEQAATVSSTFCFSTTILLPAGHKQPVFCIGESTGLEHSYSGTISGVFLFPRFQVETRARYLPVYQ